MVVRVHSRRRSYVHVYCSPLPHSMHYARIGRTVTQIRPRRKMHDFGDLGRALEMVALLPGVALGG